MIIFVPESSHGADYTDEKVMVAMLKSDTQEEIKDDLDEMEIVGWPEGYSLGFDSTVITMNWKVAKYDSTGHWNWAGQQEQ